MKVKLGAEAVTAPSWAPMGEVDQERARVVFCAALKADQPADRIVGSRRPCERQYLNEQGGCYKCRKIHTKHQSADCTTFPPSDLVIKTPSDWVPGAATTSCAGTGSPATTGTARKVALGIADAESQDNISLGFSLSNSDYNGCAFPPFLGGVGSHLRNWVVQALADTGCRLHSHLR